MNQILTLLCVIALFCVSYTHGQDSIVFYIAEGEDAQIVIAVNDANTGLNFEYPGRSYLENSPRVSYMQHPASPHGAIFNLKSVEMRDAGPIHCTTESDFSNIDLVVYEPRGKVRDVKVEPIGENRISVSWNIPKESPEIIRGYTVIVYEMPRQRAITSTVKRNVSANGQETAVLKNVPPGDYMIKLLARYAFGQSNGVRDGPANDVFTTYQLWVDQEMSVRAVALASDTVLVSYKVVGGGEAEGVNVSYTDDPAKNWTKIEMEETEQFSIVNDLKPKTTWFFKAEANTRVGKKETITYVNTPRREVIVPRDVTVTPEADENIRVKWEHQRSEETKGYKVTVERLIEGNQTYMFFTETFTSKMEVLVPGVPDDRQYRIKVRAYGVDGISEYSESVVYPEPPEATTMAAATQAPCPALKTPPLPSIETTPQAPQAPTEPATEAPTEPATEAPTEPATEAPTEQATEAPTEPTTETPTTTTSVATTEAEIDESYLLELRVVKEMPSKIRVMWFLTKGDLSKVDKFQIVLKSDTGKTLLTSKLWKKQRAISLQPVSTKADYIVIVRALDSEGNVLAEEELGTEKEVSSDPELLLEANEIRGQQARLGWILKNQEPSQLKTIRLYVYQNGPGGRLLVQRTVAIDKQTFLLPALSSESVYYVILEAIGQNNKALLRAELTFETPKAGYFGQPVKGGPVPEPASLEQNKFIFRLCPVLKLPQ